MDDHQISFNTIKVNLRIYKRNFADKTVAKPKKFLGREINIPRSLKH